MIDDLNGIRATEINAYNLAREITELQVKAAVEILEKTLPNDARRNDPATLGAVVLALATNMHGLTVARK